LIESLPLFRHGRACLGNPRARGGSFTGCVDARIKSTAVRFTGHDKPTIVLNGQEVIYRSSWPDLDPAIHAPATDLIISKEGVDHRVEPGDDDCRWSCPELRQPDLLTGQQWIKSGHDDIGR
jgi:hypothetical protein